MKKNKRTIFNLQEPAFEQVSAKDFFAMLECNKAVQLDKYIEEREAKKAVEQMTKSEIAEIHSQKKSIEMITDACRKGRLLTSQENQNISQYGMAAFETVDDNNVSVQEPNDDQSGDVDDAAEDDIIDTIEKNLEQEDEQLHKPERITSINITLDNNPEVKPGRYGTRSFTTKQEQTEDKRQRADVAPDIWTSGNNIRIDFGAFADPTKFEQHINCANKPVMWCMQEYVKYKSMSTDEAHVKNQFRSLFKYVLAIEEEFGVTLYPVVIGTMFMAQFEAYLISKKLSPGTIAGLCNLLKTVIKWSALYGAKIAIDIDQFKIKAQDSKPKVYLSDEDIVRIYYFNIGCLNVRPQLKRTLTKVKDHFVLSCFIGQRYSDTLRITPNNFHGAAKDTFQTMQLKTGNSAILNFDRVYGRYPKIVKEILEKYGYCAPWTGHLSNYNRYLHLLCKFVGLDEEIKFEYKVKNIVQEKTYKKYQLISSHVARRSFITNAVNRGVNNSVTKKASGHISDSSFNRYVLVENDYKE